MLSKPGNGGFIPSCHDHENFNDIDGVAFDTDQLLALFDGTATVTADTCVGIGGNCAVPDQRP